LSVLWTNHSEFFALLQDNEAAA